MSKKKVISSVKTKRKRINITICIDEKLYEQLEAIRITKVGSSEIINDRSSSYEKVLIMGLQHHIEQAHRNELLNKLDTSFLESLNLEEVDLSKINPELFKKRTTPSPM